MKKLKSYAYSSIIIVIAIISMSHIQSENRKINIENVTEFWQQIYNSDGVLIYHKITECHDEQNGLCYKTILLKVENSNAYKVHLKFNKALWHHDQLTYEGHDIETLVSLDIKAKSSAEGSCITNNGLTVYVQDLVHNDATRISHYQITDLQITGS